ncbi:Neuron navigator 1 [Merluccius polli]|uniref:Neuron navigator 1 n=1 Tax=Merluccius polli TaxID=89951 RepID=A0AA47NQR5_MERPO|nr:Neuron navigator 1 [Merluccius polli]
MSGRVLIGEVSPFRSLVKPRWDESSSISSGLSDGDGEVSDNLSSEEFNVSSSLNSLPTTPLGSRRNSSIMLRTDAEKRSLVESGLSWYSEVGKPSRKLDPGGGTGGYETGSLKTEAPSKWRKKPPPAQHQSASEDCTASLTGVRGEMARKPQSLGGQSGSLKKGRNPPVGVTSPITHTSQSMLKVAVQNTLPPRRVYDAGQVPPLVRIGSIMLRRVNRNIVVSRAEEKKKRLGAAVLTRGDAVK